MPNKDETIKLMYTIKCDGCNKEQVVCVAMTPPWLHWILSRENIKKAKETVKEKIKQVKFANEEDRQKALDWLNDDMNIFSPEDIEKVLFQLINLGKQNVTEEITT